MKVGGDDLIKSDPDEYEHPLVTFFPGEIPPSDKWRNPPERNILFPYLNINHGLTIFKFVLTNIKYYFLVILKKSLKKSTQALILFDAAPFRLFDGNDWVTTLTDARTWSCYFYDAICVTCAFCSPTIRPMSPSLDVRIWRLYVRFWRLMTESASFGFPTYRIR